MSLFFRDGTATEQRSISYQDVWGAGLDFNNGKTDSGETINPDSAMRLAAMWSAADLVASIVATMPIDIFQGGSVNPRKQVSPQPVVVSSPSLLVTRRDWVYQGMMSLLLQGNGYGLIVGRDNLLRPLTIEWLNPTVVQVRQTSSLEKPTYSVGGVDIPRADMIHLRAFLKPGSAIGLSPVQYHCETLGIGLAAQRYGSRWYGSGAHPSAILSNTEKTISPKQARQVKARFLASVRGKREPIVVGKDWKYESIQANADESKFLEALGYTDTQVARLFGPGVAEALGYETGGSMTYTNRENRTLDLLVFAVQKWLVKFEDMWNGILADPQYVKFNSASLLRSDTKTRYETHKVAREIGLNNVDELRELEDEPPLPDGQGEDYTPLATKPKPAQPEGQSDVTN